MGSTRGLALHAYACSDARAVESHLGPIRQAVQPQRGPASGTK